MHVETLKTFCDVVETGSLSRAARLNLVTQSAVSQQLRALERRYGRTLIDRAPRVGARPTEAGRLLYTEVKAALERLAAVEQRLREATSVVAGSVRVATVYSVGLHNLPPVIKAALRAYPQLRVRLEYRRTDQVYSACLAGEVDLGIVALPVRRPSLSMVPLRQDEMVIVAPPDHPLCRRRKLEVAALDGHPFVAFDRDIPTRRLVDRVLRQRGASVSVVMELDNIETIKRSVEAGLGLSILPLPALTSELRARTLVMRRPADGRIDRPLGVIHRRSRELPAPAMAFLKLLKDELGA
jgi:DNA-binding transcriptional LysR family regulator